jgi:3-hydroxybutyryl-CoA dehydratase
MLPSIIIKTPQLLHNCGVLIIICFVITQAEFARSLQNFTAYRGNMAEKRALAAPKGLYFEEFELGQSITSSGRTITEADVVAFAALTGDWSSIHSDAVYAANHPLGQRVAHGLLGMSIAVALAVRLGFLEDTLLAFREIRDWKFSLPIFLGDTIHMRAAVTETKKVHRLGGGLVTLEVEILNQEDKIVQHGSWSVLVKSQPEA